MAERKEHRAREHLFRHLPEALGYAHALNDALALDLHTMMQCANAAGLSTFDALDIEMIKYKPAIITAKDRAERSAFRNRIGSFNRAITMYGPGGSAIPMLLAPISKEMPPAAWHWRVAIDDNGCVQDADQERHVAAQSTTCKLGSPTHLH